MSGAPPHGPRPEPPPREPREEFLARLAHDLRSPLNGIGGFAKLMAQGRAGAVSAQQAEYLGEVLLCSNQLLQLLDDLLELLWLEAAPTAAPLSLDWPRLLADVRERLAAPAAARGIRVELEAAACAEPALARAPLQQLLQHLLGSALEWSDAGACVRLCAGPEPGAALRVEVVAPATLAGTDLEKLFGQHRSGAVGVPGGERRRSRGLAWARRLVEAHGGSVGASGAPGEPCRLFARLPRAPLP